MHVSIPLLKLSNLYPEFHFFNSQIYAASWAISVYFAYQRTWKPFNPILGETYEMTNHNGITFIAEQVGSVICMYFFNDIALP